MPRKYAIGNRAWFICQRCGQRGLYRLSKFDGYYPNLRVHPECWEDKHPQENLPKVSDPIALWRPSPEFGGVAPILEGEVIAGDDVPPIGESHQDGIFNGLVWTAAILDGDTIVSYEIYGIGSLALDGLPVLADPGSIVFADLELRGTVDGVTLEFLDTATNNLTEQCAYLIRAIGSSGEISSTVFFSSAPS